MATTKLSSWISAGKRTPNSPVRLAGLFSLLFTLYGCQTITTPEQVTVAFWKSMTQGNIESARKQVTQNTQHLVSKQQHLENASLEIGTAVIDGPNAKVATTITLEKKTEANNNVLSFNTILLKENDQWKVDYQQTLNNLSILPFGDIFKSLRAIGDAINQQLEQQLPLLEKQIRSFSEELKRQLDEFGRQLEKPVPPEKTQPYPGTI